MTWLREVFFTFDLMGRPFPVSWLVIFGLLGNALFTGRVMLQWIASERAGRSVVPAAFWWVSLWATMIHIVYALGRVNAQGIPDPDIPMFLGLTVTLVPYIRNLRIHYAPNRPPRSAKKLMLVAFALMAVIVGIWIARVPLVNWWIFALGLVGNVVFRGRFIVQWLQSESRRESHMSLTFWYMSMIGSFLLLAYSLLRGDLVFLIGFIFNTIPFVRNILLIRRHAAGQPA